MNYNVKIWLTYKLLTPGIENVILFYPLLKIKVKQAMIINYEKMKTMNTLDIYRFHILL